MITLLPVTTIASRLSPIKPVIRIPSIEDERFYLALKIASKGGVCLRFILFCLSIYLLIYLFCFCFCLCFELKVDEDNRRNYCGLESMI